VALSHLAETRLAELVTNHREECRHERNQFTGSWGPAANGETLRRKDALVYRAGLLNKTGAVEVTLRDKLNNFAHLLTKVRNSEKIFCE